jgi:hypothetical protein
VTGITTGDDGKLTTMLIEVGTKNVGMITNDGDPGITTTTLAGTDDGKWLNGMMTGEGGNWVNGGKTIELSGGRTVTGVGIVKISTDGTSVGTID